MRWTRQAAGIIAALTASSTAPALAETELRFGIFFSERANVVQEVLLPWAKWFEGEAGGTAKVKFFFGGSLGRNPAQQYQLVQSRVMDIAFVGPSYTPGTFPEFDIFEAPNMARDAIEGSQSVWRLYKKGLIGSVDKIKVVALFTTGAYSIHTTKPVRTIGDVQGLKLRAAGSVQVQVVKALGGVPVGMPPTQVAESVNRGLLDGSVSEWNAAQTFKILEVTQHHYVTSLGVLPLMIAMNRKAYEELTAPAKAAIDKSGDLMAKLQGEASDSATKKMVAAIKASGKDTLVYASEADAKAMDKAFKPVIAEIRSKAGDKLWQAYVEVLADIRAGK